MLLRTVAFLEPGPLKRKTILIIAVHAVNLPLELIRMSPGISKGAVYPRVSSCAQASLATVHAKRLGLMDHRSGASLGNFGT